MKGVDVVEDDKESMICVGQKIRDDFVKLKFIRCRTQDESSRMNCLRMKRIGASYNYNIHQNVYDLEDFEL